MELIKERERERDRRRREWRQIRLKSTLIGTSCWNLREWTASITLLLADQDVLCCVVLRSHSARSRLTTSKSHPIIHPWSLLSSKRPHDLEQANAFGPPLKRCTECRAQAVTIVTTAAWHKFRLHSGFQSGKVWTGLNNACPPDNSHLVAKWSVVAKNH